MIPITQVQVGTITLKIEGISQQETERLHKIISALIINNAFGIRNGKVIVNLDNDGDLSSIQLDFTKWRRNRAATGDRL